MVVKLFRSFGLATQMRGRLPCFQPMKSDGTWALRKTDKYDLGKADGLKRAGVFS